MGLLKALHLIELSAIVANLAIIGLEFLKEREVSWRVRLKKRVSKEKLLLPQVCDDCI